MSSEKPQTIVIMAGGTGGHIFPALAVAKNLINMGHQIKWLGSANSMESEIVPANNISLEALNITGLRGLGIKTKLMYPFKLMAAVMCSISILRKIKPSAVIGFGGFTGAPGGIASWILGIPLYVHEQNAVAGMTNRILSKFAKKVFCAFPQAFQDSDKVLVTGNPIRDEIVSLYKDFNKNKVATKNLLVVGGSRGALTLNKIVPQALSLINDVDRPRVLHQSGEKTYEVAKKAYNEFQLEAETTKFIHDMSKAYQWADVIICRAGALTVSEISAVGLPAIFVPFPYAVDDHQFMNAQSLVEAGAAKVIREEKLSPELLAETIMNMFADKRELNNMRLRSHSQAEVNAVTKITNVLLSHQGIPA